MISSYAPISFGPDSVVPSLHFAKSHSNDEKDLSVGCLCGGCHMSAKEMANIDLDSRPFRCPIRDRNRRVENG